MFPSASPGNIHGSQVLMEKRGWETRVLQITSWLRMGDTSGGPLVQVAMDHVLMAFGSLQGGQLHKEDNSRASWAVRQWRCSFKVRKLPGALETQTHVPHPAPGWFRCSPVDPASGSPLWLHHLLTPAWPGQPLLRELLPNKWQSHLFDWRKATNLVVKPPGKCSETPQGLGWVLIAAELCALPIQMWFHSFIWGCLGLIFPDEPFLGCILFLGGWSRAGRNMTEQVCGTQEFQWILNGSCCSKVEKS